MRPRVWGEAGRPAAAAARVNKLRTRWAVKRSLARAAVQSARTAHEQLLQHAPRLAVARGALVQRRRVRARRVEEVRVLRHIVAEAVPGAGWRGAGGQSCVRPHAVRAGGGGAAGGGWATRRAPPALQQWRAHRIGTVPLGACASRTAAAGARGRLGVPRGGPRPRRQRQRQRAPLAGAPLTWRACPGPARPRRGAAARGTPPSGCRATDARSGRRGAAARRRRVGPKGSTFGSPGCHSLRLEAWHRCAAELAIGTMLCALGQAVSRHACDL